MAHFINKGKSQSKGSKAPIKENLFYFQDLTKIRIFFEIDINPKFLEIYKIE